MVSEEVKSAKRFIDNLLLPAPSFVLEVADILLKEYMISVDNLEADHVCYRTSTKEEYDRIKVLFSLAGHKLLVEADIGGRPISTFQLLTPISVSITPFSTHNITCVG